MSTGSSESFVDRQRTLLHLKELHTANCAFLTRNITAASYGLDDPRPAVLMFMIAATPLASFADELSSEFDEHLSRIFATRSNVSDHHFELKNVPGAIETVPVHLAYIQIHDGQKNHLKLIWKVHRSLPLFV